MPPDATSPDFLTPRQVAARSHFSYNTVMRAIHAGHLEATKVSTGRVGTGGQWRIPNEAYRRWMRGEAPAVPAGRTA